MTMALTVVSLAGWTPELAAARVIGTLVFLAVCAAYVLWFAGRVVGSTVNGFALMRQAKAINRTRTARALAIAVIVALSLAASATKSEATIVVRCGDWCWWWY